MIPSLKYLLLTIFLVLGNIFVYGQTYRQTLHVQHPYVIDLINVDGQQTAYYELFITNFSNDTIKLRELNISNVEDSSICFQIKNEKLKNRFSKIGVLNKDSILLLAGGHAGIMYIELNLNKKVTKITHSIAFEVLHNEHLGEQTIHTFNTKCQFNNVLVLSPPLPGGAWAAIYEPSWERGHRKAIYTLNGKARIPGRYAIDFIKLDSNGKYANGSENEINNWLGYDTPVLAVADGIISSVRDDFPESKTLSNHPRYSAEKATGNYISLKINDNQFAFYEHLKPKSIKVKPGQIVKKGDIIATLGFTGQTTGPHLHFHIADADSPLGAEGIPFVFDNFEMLGSYSDFGQFGQASWLPLNKSTPSIRFQERPCPNCVIKFEAKTTNH